MHTLYETFALIQTASLPCKWTTIETTSIQNGSVQSVLLDIVQWKQNLGCHAACISNLRWSFYLVCVPICCLGLCGRLSCNSNDNDWNAAALQRQKKQWKSQTLFETRIQHILCYLVINHFAINVSVHTKQKIKPTWEFTTFKKKLKLINTWNQILLRGFVCLFTKKTKLVPTINWNWCVSANQDRHAKRKQQTMSKINKQPKCKLKAQLTQLSLFLDKDCHDAAAHFPRSVENKKKHLEGQLTKTTTSR